MISPCTETDVQQIYNVINAAASAYNGVIPADCWHEPYMSLPELQSEINAGVSFIVHFDKDSLIGVMGSQDVLDVTLIRHAYVLPRYQGQGIGHSLLDHLLSSLTRPALVGTWTAATWAIRFYERHNFKAAPSEEIRFLLERYWSIPERQIEESTVLVGPGWFDE